MSSKQINNLGKLGSRVAAATSDPRRNRRAMAGVIARCADVVPEGTTSITLEEAQHYLGRQLEHEIRAVRGLDDDHVETLIDSRDTRRERDDASAETYGVMLNTRRAFEALFGEGSGIRLLGLDIRVPDDPRRLYQTADRCRRWLRDPARPLPAVQVPGWRFEREELAAGLDGPLQRLDRALEALPVDEKESVDTLVSKLISMRRLDQLIGRVARLMESLYDVAGMEGESDRLRLSSHGASVAQVSAQPAEPVPTEQEEAEESEPEAADTDDATETAVETA
ncbi:MAG: hypothetical protein GY719_37395 [bacterium]|nr:hypothetical protein [bacterium]